jgi:Conjugal transfer protein TraD
MPTMAQTPRLTDAERDAEARKKTQQKIEALKRHLATLEARDRARAKRDREHRERQLGRLAVAAGLGAVEDAVLAEAFLVLATRLSGGSEG